jgi:hypothetical protein
VLQSGLGGKKVNCVRITATITVGLLL